MVKIKNIIEEEDETANGDTTEEENDNDDIPPDPSDAPQAPGVSTTPEPAAQEPVTPEPSVEPEQPRPRGTGVMSPTIRAGLRRQNVSYLLRQYGHSIELSRSLQTGAQGSIIIEGLNNWATELQQMVGPSNGYSDSSTPESEDDDQGHQGCRARAAAAETSSETTRRLIDDDYDKVESDESAGEKSNGESEKQQLTVTSAAAKMELLSSPGLSDNENANVSDSALLEPAAYNPFQAQSSQDFAPTASIEQEDTESAEGQEPSEASDEGEAAALPATAVAKDCWEEWVDDNRLFTLSDAPSTSAGPSSPVEDRRTRMEKRQHFRQNTPALISRYIFVPTEKIGRIVGKGGRRVKEIEAKTGAKIKVENKKSSKPVTQITLTGTDAQICKADEDICLIIRNFKPPRSGEPTTASVSSYEEMQLKRLVIGIKFQVLDGEKRCRKPAI